MRKDRDGFDRLESWDEIHLLKFEGVDTSQFQRRAEGCDSDRFLDFVKEALVDNQSFGILTGETPWHVYFPYAWDRLSVDDQVHNRDSGEAYTVKEVFYDREKHPTGQVVLTGITAPKDTDALRLTDEKLLDIFEAYPRQQHSSVKPIDDVAGKAKSELGLRPGRWKDAITFHVSREEPAGQTRPFGPDKVAKRHKEYVPYEDDLTGLWQVKLESEITEALIQFDVWAQSPERARLLLRWLRDFMRRYTWVFKYNGVVDIRFWRRFTDELAVRWRQDTYHRSIQFYARFEHIEKYVVRSLNRIRMNVSVGANIREVTGFETPVFPSDSLEAELQDRSTAISS